MEYDVVVIGAGLSGLFAALTSVSRTSRTIVLARGIGNISSSDGYIGMLGYNPDTGNSDIKNPIAEIEKLIEKRPEHPYSSVGRAMIQESIDFFLKTLSEIGMPYSGSVEKNLMMPTSAGTFIPAAFVPETQVCDLSGFKEIIILGISEFMDFFPELFCGNISSEYKKAEISVQWISLGIKADRGLNAIDIANALESKEIRAKLIDKLKAVRKKGSLFILPAVLGFRKSNQVISEIRSEIDAHILEIPTLPPVITGCRLENSLQVLLLKRGVEILTGNSVTVSETNGKTCLEVALNSGKRIIKKIKGKSFILATGGVLGGGIEVGMNDMKETVFDLPVKQIWPNGDNYFERKGITVSSSGIFVNKCLQPLATDSKEIIFENIFVAGSALSGYDQYMEKSCNGVNIATGYKAGINASKRGVCE